MEKEVLDLLERWMNNKEIKKEDQIKYYKKIITTLENDKLELKDKIRKNILAFSTIGFGTGMLFPDQQNLDIYLGILFIIYGIIVIFPEKKETKQIDEIEEKRQLIKKWYQKEKE